MNRLNILFHCYKIFAEYLSVWVASFFTLCIVTFVVVNQLMYLRLTEVSNL